MSVTQAKGEHRTGTGRRLLAIALAALTGAALAGISGRPPSVFERQGAADRYERAALDWWSRLQRGDVAGVLRLTPSQDRAALPRKRLVSALAGALGDRLRATRATVVASERSGAARRVILRLDTRPRGQPVTATETWVLGVRVGGPAGALRVAATSWLRKELGLDPLAPADAAARRAEAR